MPADVQRPGEGESAVAVWTLETTAVPTALDRLQSLLDASERARAGRYRFERDCRRFVVRRACLRLLLADHVGVPPERLRFEASPTGKLRLADGLSPVPFEFSLSQSEDLAVFAIATERRLGVDVERVATDRPLADLARRFFSPVEVSALEAAPPGERVNSFYRCWTAKEAFLKARGDGLSLPLDSFAVDFGAHAPPALLSFAGDAAEVSRWSFAWLSLGSAYAGALVAEGPAVRPEVRPVDAEILSSGSTSVVRSRLP